MQNWKIAFLAKSLCNFLLIQSDFASIQVPLKEWLLPFQFLWMILILGFEQLLVILTVSMLILMDIILIGTSTQIWGIYLVVSHGFISQVLNYISNLMLL